MAGDWIKLRCSLSRDGRVRKMSRSLSTDVTHVIGGLAMLWFLGDEQADDQGQLYGYKKDDIDDFIGVKGFCDALPECWIDTTGEWIKLPEYQEHNGSTGKKRAQDQKRQKKSRKKVESERDENATREEKRREEIKDICEAAISHLNEKANKNFKCTDSQIKFISSRLDEGYSQDDLVKVIDAKCREWLNTDQDKYLRPETLFNATKFNSYHGNLGKEHDPAKGAK